MESLTNKIGLFLQNVTVEICKDKSNSPKGSPYFRAYDISIIPESVPDQGLLAKVKEGSVSGLAYEYVDLKR
jgi:hypothetical protein